MNLQQAHAPHGRFSSWAGSASGVTRCVGSAALAQALLWAIGLWILLVFDRYGITNDEPVQHAYGQLLLDFYRSGFEMVEVFGFRNLYLYGGFFDMLAAWLQPYAGNLSVWDLRHLLSALFGLAGLVATWKLARLLAGDRAALLALVLLWLTGAWSGAIFHHTKDIPFAACMTWSLYYIVRIVPALPRVPPSLAIRLGVAIGCTFGLRVGAVFAVATLGLTILAAAWLSSPTWRERLRFVLKACWSLWPAVLIAVALTAFFWPWVVMGPDHLFKALNTFSHFAFDLDTVIAGQVIPIDQTPRYYLPLYLLVRLPELSLVGLACAAGFGLRAILSRHALLWPAARDLVPLTVAALLPLTLAMLTKPPLYNGIRHFLFIVPPLSVLAALGLCALWSRLRYSPRLRRLLVLGAVLLLIPPLQSQIRLHPYQYLQYNLLVGGLRGADQNWETDYWSTSLREAAKLLRARLATEKDFEKRSYLVAVCAEHVQADEWLPPNLVVTDDWRRADFFMSTTHMDCHDAMRGELIASVERMGVKLAVVEDRRKLIGSERDPQ